MQTEAAIALSRFGLGHRAGEAPPADPRAWLRDQIHGPDDYDKGNLLDLNQSLGLLHDIQRAALALKRENTGQSLREMPNEPTVKAFKDNVQAEISGFLGHALVTRTPFRERLVWFWANHFTISLRSRPINASAGPYLRDAIRAHVTGRFEDMLLAVMKHPAMLAYLDQAESSGPNSPFGQKRHRGLNENLARECLELHTVTPASGYTQADVTAFARLLTGRSISYGREPFGYSYDENRHEPGAQQIMGRTWQDGDEGIDTFLRWLARHPATYRHLATKLVRHFVSDDPPERDIATIADVLHATDGNLADASEAIINLPSAWTPLSKFRAPQDYAIAVMRAVGARPEYETHLRGLLDHLGQNPLHAPFPIGWPDTAADWSSPEAVLQRIDFAYQFAGRVTDKDPVQVATETLGPLLTEETLRQIRFAGSRQDGLTILFASPEMQRR